MLIVKNIFICGNFWDFWQNLQFSLRFRRLKMLTSKSKILHRFFSCIRNFLWARKNRKKFKNGLPYCIHHTYCIQQLLSRIQFTLMEHNNILTAHITTSLHKLPSHAVSVISPYSLHFKITSRTLKTSLIIARFSKKACVCNGLQLFNNNTTNFHQPMHHNNTTAAVRCRVVLCTVLQWPHRTA